jgi:hypothetical protein
MGNDRETVNGVPALLSSPARCFPPPDCGSAPAGVPLLVVGSGFVMVLDRGPQSLARRVRRAPSPSVLAEQTGVEEAAEVVRRRPERDVGSRRAGRAVARARQAVPECDDHPRGHDRSSTRPSRAAQRRLARAIWSSRRRICRICASTHGRPTASRPGPVHTVRERTDGDDVEVGHRRPDRHVRVEVAGRQPCDDLVHQVRDVLGRRADERRRTASGIRDVRTFIVETSVRPGSPRPALGRAVCSSLTPPERPPPRSSAAPGPASSSRRSRPTRRSRP